ncbi:MAG: hypothetical protein H6709_01250 [Kofleriaceae bacterium]|nr:hypothetical protein [Myxococcales bacterium]MCB9570695.1 hypothetical protein [Kofleriaceae bacterium]
MPRDSAEPRPRRIMSLWSIVESLQRRLERQGLSREVVDVAVVNALRGAARSAS